MIRGLSHFSFTVSDVDPSARWHVEMLGFEVRRRQRQHTKYTADHLALPDAVIPPGRVCEAMPALELIEYATPVPIGEPTVPGMRGFAHLALVVDDIHALYAISLAAACCSEAHRSRLQLGSTP
jgi:lactoylglutathione lyase